MKTVEDIKAEEKFISHVERSKELCKLINEKLENFLDVSPEDINWSHAGSAGHIVGQLQEICYFLGIKDLKSVNFEERVKSGDYDILPQEKFKRDMFKYLDLDIGVFPTGIVWCDRYHEKNGDYKRLAYLNFKTLVLDIEKDCPAELIARIELDAKELQDKKGENFQVSSSGQTIVLGE